jgi:hypothetical protein
MNESAGNLACLRSRPVIGKTLKHLGVQAQPPAKMPAREAVLHHAD